MARIKLFIFISPDPLICDVKSSKYIRICQGPDQVSEVSAAQARVVILGKQERIPLRTYDRNRLLFCAQGFSGTLTLQANNYSLSLVERRPLPVPGGTLSHSGQQLTQASASKWGVLHGLEKITILLYNLKVIVISFNEICMLKEKEVSRH